MSDESKQVLRHVADWLEEHAKGKRVDFYCPSKSGDGACNNAAEALRAIADETETRGWKWHRENVATKRWPWKDPIAAFRERLAES